MESDIGIYATLHINDITHIYSARLIRFITNYR